MARADNQIVGVCRFSYPAMGGFRLSSLEAGALEEALWDPVRMQRRMTLFENVCLPSLAAQTDPDFTLVVLCGDAMPLRWRRRLKALRAAHPFLRICALEPAGPLQATRRAFRAGAREEVPFVTGFRIDDDDALAVDYVERLRVRADAMLDAGWADAETPVAITFQTGLFWALDAPGQPVYRYTETSPPGQASAMVTVFDSQHNIFRWTHTHLAAHVRLWAEPGPEMFVRTLHGGNDSDRRVSRRAERLDEREGATLLRDRFGLAPLRIRPLLGRFLGARE